MSFSPLSTNHRLCQLCRRDPHFIRYPDSTGLEGEEASPAPDTGGETTCGFVFGDASSESDEVSWWRFGDWEGEEEMRGA